jgi:hypothetical protein
VAVSRGEKLVFIAAQKKRVNYEHVLALSLCINTPRNHVRM